MSLRLTYSFKTTFQKSLAFIQKAAGFFLNRINRFPGALPDIPKLAALSAYTFPHGVNP